VATRDRQRVRFATASPLRSELRSQVTGYFRENGLTPHATWGFYAKAAAVLATAVALYAVFLMIPLSGMTLLAVAACFGLAQTGIAFNTQHDGSHGAVSQYKGVNRAFAASLDLLGMSSYYWHWKHGVFHHTHPNVSQYDGDVEAGPLARLAPWQPARRLHRFQRFYLWALYPWLSIKWEFWDDPVAFLSGRLEGRRVPRPRGQELAIFLGGKIGFVLWSLALPLAIYEPVTALAFFLISQATGSLASSTIFQLAHCVEEAEWCVPPAGEAPLELDWASHQIATAVDFPVSNRLLRGLLGGLDRQTVHHLFPQVCHVHYPALSRIVSEVCARHGVRHRSHAGLWGALRSHDSWLDRMGRPTHERAQLADDTCRSFTPASRKRSSEVSPSGYSVL